MVGASLFDVDTAYLQIVITMAVLAAGMALTMTPMTTQLMAAVPRDRAGMGSATNDTTRELGGALGVAVLGSLVTGKYAAGVAPAVSGMAADVQETAKASLGGVYGLIERGLVPQADAAALLDTAKRAFVSGFGLACMVAAVVVIINAVVVYKFLPSDRKSEAVTGIEDLDESVDTAAVAGD